MVQLDLKSFNNLAIGAGIFSTGGGMTLPYQMRKAKELIESGKTLKLIGIDELQFSDWICTAYAIGSAGNNDINLGPAFQAGLARMQEIVGHEFKAVFAGEANIESLVFEAAGSLDLPVLDADATGGRAVPEIQYDNWFVKGVSTAPIVAVTSKGEVNVLENETDPIVIEKFIRDLAVRTKDSVAVVDHACQVDQARELLSLGTLSRSLKLGEALERDSATNAVELLKKMGASVLIEGRIKSLGLVNDDTRGYLEGYYEIESENGDVLKIFARNENIAAWLNGELTVSCPDSIIVVDGQSRNAVHNSELQIGANVFVVSFPATPIWDSEAGRALFSLDKFGLRAS